MRRPSIRISSRAVRESMRSTMSTACAWCAIIPCMKRTSAGVYATCDRSAAAVAAITRLDSPERRVARSPLGCEEALWHAAATPPVSRTMERRIGLVTSHHCKAGQPPLVGQVGTVCGLAAARIAWPLGRRASQRIQHGRGDVVNRGEVGGAISSGGSPSVFTSTRAFV